MRKYVPLAQSVLVPEERAIPNDTIEGPAQRRPLTIGRRRANHRGWRSKWGWEMGNAHVPMTQIATVCLPEKWHREGAGWVPASGLWHRAVALGTRGGNIDSWGRGREMKFEGAKKSGVGWEGERDGKSVKALIRSVHPRCLMSL